MGITTIRLEDILARGGDTPALFMGQCRRARKKGAIVKLVVTSAALTPYGVQLAGRAPNRVLPEHIVRSQAFFREAHMVVFQHGGQEFKWKDWNGPTPRTI